MGKSDADFLREVSKTCGHPVSTLKKVLSRGYGAYRTNPGSVRNVKGVKGGPGRKMSASQWARARVNSFCRGSRKHDLDLRRR